MQREASDKEMKRATWGCDAVGERRKKNRVMGRGEQPDKKEQERSYTFYKNSGGAPAHQRVGQARLAVRWILCFALLPVCLLLKHGITYVSPFAGALAFPQTYAPSPCVLLFCASASLIQLHQSAGPPGALR